MTPEERIESYNARMPYPRSLFLGGDGRIVGTWLMGNNYRTSSAIYGGYPNGYLKRVRALFPDKRSTLHLFSGQVDRTAWPGDTLDIRPEVNPTYLCDAEQSLRGVPLESYDIVLADPPYSVEDAERYQTTMVKQNKVVRRLPEGCRPGTHVVWLDQVLPMYRRSEWSIIGVIGMVRSTSHRFRMITIFERSGNRRVRSARSHAPTVATVARRGVESGR